MKTAIFNILTTLFLLCSFRTSYAQVLTKEDSLAAGLLASTTATVLSGYGNVNYTNNLTDKQSNINLDRVVLFVGHKFSKKISFFSELEIEDAKIVGGSASGEISFEQAFLKFNINRSNYITAGLFIPRIGIINENHLPTTFSSNNRPFVEKYVIPATWRELGVGYYGSSQRIAGLNYSCALVNGLNSPSFESGTGIREGRFEGRDANANSIAVTGALLHYYKNFRTQVSAYYGGSLGISKASADTLGLNTGLFGTPVGLYEANVQYIGKHLFFKALGCFVTIRDAAKLNAVYGNNTPEQYFGGYFEAGYKHSTKNSKIWQAYARYEYMDLNLKLPSNAVLNHSLTRRYIVAGVNFQPVAGVIVKLDYTLMISNAAPISNTPVTKQKNLINLGVGYSF
jgi:hypothetical protein